MKYVFTLMMVLSAWSARAYDLTWTNTAGGDWSVAANWSPNAVPVPGNTANITTPGTYTVTITSSSGVSVSNLNVGALGGTQTLIQGSTTPLNVTNAGAISGGGVLVVTNGGVTGNLTVNLGAAMVLGGSSSSLLQLYNLDLINEGTVTWGGGGLEFGTTLVENSGTWLMTNDATIDLGGPTSTFINSGVLRKTATTGTSTFSGITFLNEPGGLVDGLSGTISLSGGGNCVLGGTLNATVPGTVTISGATWTEAGAVATGTGTNQFTSGTLNLVTNNVPGLTLLGGNLYITGASTFQQAGAITNLTLSGAQLNGTNRVGAGMLTFNGGSLVGQLTVLPSGQLLVATATSKLFYGLTLLNQGTVDWTGGTLNFGTTVVSNGGVWLCSSDNSISFGGGTTPVWTNTGTLRKTAATGTTTLGAINFTNQTGGLVEADSGALQLPSGTTNTAGTLYLNGGTNSGTGTLGFTGGVLEGSGSIGATSLTGGSITPGLGGPGAISFSSGLNLSTGATLIVDGTGTVPGSQYDQLTVTGAVALGNATLQVSALPAVPVGTTFFIITNTGSSAVSGTFNGLAENGLLGASGQPFRIHYAGGARANAVTLVRDAGLALTNGMSGGGNFTLTGSGTGPGVYEIQATTNFINWTNIGSATAGAGGNFTFTDTNAALFNYRFYRTTN